MTSEISRRPFSMFRAFLDNSASGGIVLMFAAAAALIVANSQLAPAYFGALAAYIGPLSLSHWINDALMAGFFLFVGLEIKREMLDGQLATWPRRILPGVAALGGMIAPALVFTWYNYGNVETMRGWAIPTATDIAFALGVLSLLGNRVPAALKVFLTALAIIDDLGAVVIIALFYTADLSVPALGGAAVVLGALVALNRRGVLSLTPYLLLGALLWIFVLKSGVHSTIAGVLLALTIPLRRSAGLEGDLRVSPLHRLEHALHYVAPFIIIPIFGFANAGVSFAGMSLGNLVDPLTLGVAGGLLLGKVVGVYGFTFLIIRSGLVEMPANSRWVHILGVSLLCGIGFTMSLFIGLLAFEGQADLQNEVKLGIIAGSVAAALLGALVLRLSPLPAPQVASGQS